MGLFKKKIVKKTYDREHMKPVIRASICTGEEVAGFKDIRTGKIEENMLISIAFRKWANNVLKQYIMKGYAINEKRLLEVQKTVDIQSRMLADVLDIEESDVLRAVNEYTEALLLFDKMRSSEFCQLSC